MTWSATNLASLASSGPQYGANARAISATGERPRYVRITDIDTNGRLIPTSIVEADLEKSSDFLLKEGDLLFARSGNTVGKTYRYDSKDGPCLFAGYLIRFRIDPKLADSRFVFYYTLSSDYKAWVMSKRRIAGQPNINGKEYSALRVPFFPLSEQQRIVEILDQATALRRRRADADAKAARILPALFYKMFGDPATNPRGWEMVLLEDVLADTRNGLYKHGDFYGRGTQILKMFNIQSGELELSRVDRVELTGDEAKKYALNPGDILINRVNTKELVGKCAVITSNLGPAVFESKNIRARLKPDRATPEFVAHYLNTTFGHAALCQGVKHAIGMATINNTDLRKMAIPRPPLELQKIWDGLVRQIRESQQSRRKVCERFDQLLDVLLYRAFTGDLTAKWRVAHMNELLQEMEQQAKSLNLRMES